MNPIARVSAALLVVAAAWAPGSASAALVGIALSGGSGDGDARERGFFGESSGPIEFDTSLGEIAFALQAGNPDRRFMYRLDVGYVRGEFEYDAGTDDVTGFLLTNTFGARLVNSPGYRLWLGAALVGGRLEVDGDVTFDKDDTIVFAWGPSLGMDFVAGGTTVGLDVTARYFDATDSIFDSYEFDDIAVRLTLLWGD